MGRGEMTDHGRQIQTTDDGMEMVMEFVDTRTIGDVSEFVRVPVLDIPDALWKRSREAVNGDH